MEKTAMQELIDTLIEQKGFMQPLEYGYVMNRAIKLLEKEKQQIVDAADWHCKINYVEYEKGEQYYTQTFTPNLTP